MARFLAKVRKAIVAGVTVALGTYVSAYPDGVTAQEWATIVGSAVLAVAGVFYVRNAPWKSAPGE